MSDLDINETVVLEARFTGDDGSSASPQTPVQATILPPGADTVDGPFTMTAAATGVFQYDYTASAAGQHQWKATTSDGAIKQDSFYVRADRTA